MKWLKCLFCALFLASVIVVPIGCGDSGATDITATEEAAGEEGHEEAFNEGQAAGAEGQQGEEGGDAGAEGPG